MKMNHTQRIHKDVYVDDHKKIHSTHVRFPWVPKAAGLTFPKTRAFFPCKLGYPIKGIGNVNPRRLGSRVPTKTDDIMQCIRKWLILLNFIWMFRYFNVDTYSQ